MALALETPPVGDEAVQVEVTESASVIVNLDNRNTRPADVGSQVDDHWSMVYNRLHGHASWGSLRLDLRLDTAYYVSSRSPSDVALTLLDLSRRDRPDSSYTDEDAAFFVRKYLEAGDEMSNRFVDWTYPAKLSLGHQSRNLELTVGDFYAQYGQGLVLSVRKQDELSSDTTIRGVRAVGRLRTNPVRFTFGVLGGTLNPLRIDDTSGRHLAVTEGALSGVASVTETAMPRAIENDFVPVPRPSYAPDAMLGLEFEGRSDLVGIGVHGTRLSRSCLDTSEGCLPLSRDLVRSAALIDTAGVSLDLPRLGDGAAYFEYAVQRMAEFRGVERSPSSGNALYGRVNWVIDPVALSLEGRHYRSFYPLRANVDVGSAPEFAPVQYSTPPTAEDLWVDTEFEEFNTCVTGGRLRVDVETSPYSALFGWIGRHHTWGESVAAGRCEVRAENLNRVWDLAQGIELSSATRRSYGNLSVGARFDSTERLLTDAVGRQTDVFYRELYLRHDVTFGLPGDMALQLQAWHRRRRQTLGGPPTPWLQGQTVTALQFDAHWGCAVGFEYDENPAFPDLYLNGQVRYDFDIGNVTLFAGQRQGGLRCVSGICRVFPPFEGVRLDATLRF